MYLHGCGDAYESQTPLYRQSMHRSEATRLAGDRAMTQAGISPEQIEVVDLYTCFPIAAQVRTPFQFSIYNRRFFNDSSIENEIRVVSARFAGGFGLCF